MGLDLPQLTFEAPVKGMNSRDDIKDLKPGECVQLTNARPGNPPVPIRGSRHHKIADTVDYVYASHAAAYKTTDGTWWAIVWIKDGTDYKLLKINLTTWVTESLGTATGLTDPAFRFIRVWNYIYSIVDDDMYWDGSDTATRHKIIELDNENAVVREMSIDIAAQVAGIATDTGDTTHAAGFYNYAITFVRLTETDAFDSDGLPQLIETYSPGVVEGVENTSYRKTAGDASLTFSSTISLYDSSLDQDIGDARAQGITHVRIHRTRLQTTEALAQDATLFYLMDLPLPDNLPQRLVANIELQADNLTLTVTGHGYSPGNALLMDLSENTDLNGTVNAFTVDDANTLNITGTDTDSFDAYSSGGKVSIDYFSIASVDLLSASLVRIVTTADHGWSTNDTVFVAGVTGGSGGTGQTYKKWVYTSLPEGSNWWEYPGFVPRWVMVNFDSGSWIGVNGSSYTITKIDNRTVELQGTDVTDYLMPFLTESEKDPIYSIADKVPTMTGGYIASTLKNITGFSAPGNEVIVKTTTPHNMETGYYALIEDLAGSTQLNNYSGVVEVLDTTRFQFTGKSTNGISAWTSGGTVSPSTKQTVYEDDTSDATLAGETAQMVMTTYSAAPKAAFSEYALNRMWLFGLYGLENGRAYYSETPGGAGATPTDAALQFPQKFASMYNYNYYIDMSVKKGNLPSGIIRLGGDLFFYFDGEIHSLFGSDPTLADVTLITDELGCAFPDTLVRGDSENLDGEFLFFLSNNGPAITKRGGETVLFTEWKCAELWPDVNRELFVDLKTTDAREHIIHHCSAEFWKNTLWVSYETSAGIKRNFAYYFNPRLRKEPQTAPHGAYEVIGASL